jgi:hypothetical protein
LAVPDQDSAHWLYRFTGSQWLAAADHELAQADLALGRRAVRVAVTHARRGAGMALNAILCVTPEPEWPPWGRSYMEHVTALASDPHPPAEVQAAAAFLRDTPPQAPALVQLGRPDRRSLEAAHTIVDWARGESDSRAK